MKSTADCVKLGRLFASNLAGKTRVYLFGSIAIALKKIQNPARIEFFKEDSDLYFFLEVDPKIFNFYREKCSKKKLCFNGVPCGHVESPVAERVDVIFEKILKLSDDIYKEIIKELGHHEFDIMMLLPHGWQKNEEILEVLNSKYPKFSDALREDSILLFKKEG